MSANKNRFKLNDGRAIPVVGLGTFKTANDKEALNNAIKYALNCGYEHFDCAWLYSNEDVIGEAIKESIKESNGSLKREDLFIVSKVWNTHHSRDLVKQQFQETLKNLDCDYLDLYLLHWPMGFAENKNMGPFPKNENGHMMFSDVHYLEPYRAMEELVKEGLVKSIGVSNFNIEQLKDVLSNCQIKPVVNQIEVHPYLQNEELVDFCQKNDIVITAYGPMGAPDRSWAKSDEPVVLQDPYILGLAKKYDATPAQIILKWLIQRNIVVIPKAITPSRIKENIQNVNFNLTDEEMQEFKKLNKNFRIYGVQHLNTHPYYPFTELK